MSTSKTAQRDQAAALTRCVSAAPAVFAREYWGVRPLYSPASCLPADFSDLFSSAAADELLTDRALRTPFIRMAKEGAVLPPERFTAPGGFGAQVSDQVDSAMVLREFAEGATIVLQGLHRSWPALRAFTRRLVAELGHPAQVNAYITPESSRGFDPHYDVHDVFVLQVSGEKHWSVHAPVREHPRADEPWSARRAAVEARAREKPVIDVIMRPGDALYLPSGWLHSAVARQGTSIHLTIGVAALTGADVVRELAAEVSRNPDLRAPLPINRSDAGPDVLDGVVRKIISDFARALEVHSAGDGPARTASAVRRSFQRMTRPEPVAPLATVDAANDLSPKAVIRLRDGLTAQVDVDATGVHLAAADQALRLPAECEMAIRALASGERLWAGALPDLDEADSLVVTRRLLRSGMLVAEPGD
ncbi:MAG TPA: cupin domain-containing protein [Streptosporangiaceae bacterium]|nr:cupin domain-containing protein [Streptosporangiaceae bacterium]